MMSRERRQHSITLASLENVSKISMLAHAKGTERTCPSRTDHLYGAEAPEMLCHALENACRLAFAERRWLDEIIVEHRAQSEEHIGLGEISRIT